MAKGKKNVKVKKEKGAKAKEKAKKIQSIYVVENGRLVRNRMTCPKCGAGYYMAMHYDRRTCGNCNYTQFLDRNGNVRGKTRMRRRRPRRIRRPVPSTTTTTRDRK
ncbi:MAG: 30S ribosomal protein S27ae [Promethearchaeota archaeon]